MPHKLDPLRNKGQFTGYHDSHGKPVHVGDLICIAWIWGVNTAYQIHRVCQDDRGTYIRGHSCNTWSENEGAIWPEEEAIHELGLPIDEPSGPFGHYIVYDKETGIPRVATNADIWGVEAAAQMEQDRRDLERRLLFGDKDAEQKPSP